MRQGHHHGPHLGHRPWPRRGVGAVLARGGVGECRRVPCEELGPCAVLGTEHCAHGGQRLVACLFSRVAGIESYTIDAESLEWE